jgi:hypothetical protein
MEAENTLGAASSKITVLSRQNQCIFCTHPFSATRPATTLVHKTNNNLFAKCRERNDAIGNDLLALETEIQNKTITVKYHRDCRATYVSPLHVQRSKAMSPENKENIESIHDENNGTTSDAASFTRSKAAAEFKWKKKCFICSEKCDPKHRNTWSMVESLTGDKHSDSIFTKMVKAAEIRKDSNMLTRLQGVPNRDLVAVEARYHRKKACYVKYTRNIPQPSATQNNESDSYQLALMKLIEEYKPAIVEERRVFLLSTMKARFHQLMKDEGITNENLPRSHILKSSLSQEWDSIIFLPQDGQSDLVCSSDITVKGVLIKERDLSHDLKNIQIANDVSMERDGSLHLDDSSIIHHAVGILRQRMKETKELDSEYYSAEEMSLKAEQDFVDPLLYKAIGWLTNEKLYSDITDISLLNPDPVCLAIACDITTKSTSIASPKHLGLAVDLHHEYGSRKLIEDISALGHCISYTELHHFLTSAATYVNSLQQPSRSGCYVPPEIIPRGEGGHFIVGGGDNWDHNERTIDGKRTTHA